MLQFDQCECTDKQLVLADHAISILIEILELTQQLLLLHRCHDLHRDELHDGHLQFVFHLEFAQFPNNMVLNGAFGFVVLDPRVIEGIVCRDTLTWLVEEHPTYQIFCLNGHLGPIITCS